MGERGNSFRERREHGVAMPFAVLRIQKLKTWGAIAGSGKHNRRERDTPNADASRTAQNTVLIGSPEKNSVDAVKEAVSSQRIRSNAVLGVEMLLSASPDYYRPDAPEKAGTYEPERLQAWTQTATQWLQERYGGRIISATLHLDEATPHIHALLVPLDDRGKLNCRALFGGSKHTLSLLQSDYAQAVADIGIERGIQNSRATHQKVSQFYALVQTKSEQKLPLAQRYAPPEMPSKIARMADGALTQYARQAATNGAKAQRETLEPIVAAVRSESALLKRENMNLKKANSLLAKKKTDMQKQLEQIRGLDLGSALSRIFKAKGPYGPKGHPNRYILPDKREVFVSDTKWKIPPAKRGKGAIDLVMALRGYGQNELTKAIGELAHSFGVEKVTGECIAQSLDRTTESVRDAAKAYALDKSPSLSQGRSLSINR